MKLNLIFLLFSSFYIFGSLYFFYLPSILLLLLYVFSFFVGWYTTNLNLKFKSLSYFNFYKNDLINIRLISYLIFYSILIFSFYLIFSIGLSEFFLVSRADRALITREFFFISISDSVLIGLYWLIISSYLYIRKKPDLTLWTIFVILALYGLLTISLSTLVSIIIPLLFFIRMNNSKLFILLFILSLIGFAVSCFWKPLMSSLLLSSSFQLTDLKFPVEFYTWVKIMIDINSNHFNFFWNEMHFGQTFVDTIYCTFFPFYQIDPLSVRYVKTFDPVIYYAGGGRGFSLPLESFINFSYLGPIILGYSVGFFFKLLNIHRNKYFIFYFINLCFASIIFKFFRSESYAIIKPLVWLQIIPSFCILLAYKSFILLKKLLSSDC